MSMAFRFGTQTLMGRGPPNVSSSMPSRFFRPTVAASPCPHYSMITRSSAAGGAFSRRQHRDFSQFLRNREKSWCCRRENLHLSITSATAVAHRPPTQLVVFRCTDAALQQTRRSVLTPFSTQTLHQVLYFSTSDPCRSPSEGGQSSPGKYTGARRDERKKSYDPRDPENQSFWQRTLGVGAAGYAAFKILPGLKIAVPLLKLTKAGPLASLLLSSLAYTAVFGWQYGLGMISLIFVHETGHALMMKYLRVPTGPMTFIPFMGAAVEMRGYPKNAAHEAAIGIAGPILGSLGAVVPFAYGLATGSQLAFALAHWGFLINLFNLMPIGDMDGGRITSGLSPWFLVAGLGGNACLLYAMPHHPILYLTMLGGCYSGKGSSCMGGNHIAKGSDDKFWL